MKITVKPTPLFVASIGLILFAIYSILFPDKRDTEGWGIFIGMITGGFGIAALILHGVLRIILKRNIWMLVAIEIMVIAGVLYYHYQVRGHLEFQLPYNYKGYVILVYEVDNAPELTTSISSDKIKIVVPPSGIVLTSSPPNPKYVDPERFFESALGEYNELPEGRRSFNLWRDTLDCENKKYRSAIWEVREESGWTEENNLAHQLDPKLVEACLLAKESAQKKPLH